jgi:hypothetical protein
MFLFHASERFVKVQIMLISKTPYCYTDFLLRHGGLGEVGESLAALELGVLDDIGASVAGEVAGPGQD